MAFKNSIASNHLSEVSQLGRGRDNKIRSIDGQMSHVNPEEASLVDMYGSVGENVVKNIGSGDINPNTGLPEYSLTIGTLLALGSLATGAYSAWKGGQTSRQESGAQAGAARQGMEDAATAESNLEKVRESQTNVASQEYDKGIRDLSAQTGMGIEDLNRNTQQQMQKSGMATSGGVEGMSSTAWRRIQTQHESGAGGLMATLGKKMGDITEMYEAEKTRLSGESKRFQREYDLAKEKESSWYLGKTIEAGVTGKTGAWK